MRRRWWRNFLKVVNQAGRYTWVEKEAYHDWPMRMDKIE
jgi:hypothetical protein